LKEFIQFPIIKGKILYRLFRNYSQTEVKEKQRNLTINGKNSETHVAVAIVILW